MSADNLLADLLWFTGSDAAAQSSPTCKPQQQQQNLNKTYSPFLIWTWWNNLEKASSRMMNKNSILMVAASVGLLCLAVALADDQDQGTASQKGPESNITCGTMRDLAARVEICARPAMDIMEGTQEKWLRNEDDSHELCLNLTAAEKCMKEEGRRCGKGLQKTIISTLATSIQRARKQECVRSNYAEIVRTMQCVEKNQDKFRFLIANVTNQFKAVDKQLTSVEKINGICCTVTGLEGNMKNLLDAICPEQTHMIMRLFRAISEDVLELVCRTVKCDHVFRGIVIEKVKLDPDRTKHSGLIETILGLIFSLDSN